MLALVSVLAAVAIVYGITLFVKDQKIKEQNEKLESINRELDAANTTLAEKNDELDKTNAELKTTNDELDKINKDLDIANKDLAEKKNRLAKESAEASLSEGKLQLEAGELKKVVKSALDAINSCEDIEYGEEKTKYKDQAEFLLSQALGAGQYENFLHTVFTIEQESAVDVIMLSEDGRNLYTMDGNGYIRCYSTEDGQLFWKANAGTKRGHYVTNRQRMVELKECGLLICMGQDMVSALSLSDGKIKWNRKLGSINYSDFYVFNKDKSKLAVLYKRSFSTDTSDVDKFIILDTQDGNIEKEIAVGEAFGGENIISFGNCPGVFTENEKILYGLGYYSVGFGAEGSCLFKVDIEDESVKVIRTEHMARDFGSGNGLEGRYPFVIGMGYDAEGQKLVFAHYDAWDGVIVTEEYSEKEGTFRDIVYGEDETDINTESEEIETDSGSGKTETDNESWEASSQIKHRGVNFQIPNRDTYAEYQTTFVRDGQLMLYSVESFGFVYSFNSGKMVYEFRNSDARIHNIKRLSTEFGGIATLTNDGYQNVRWTKNGISMAPFCDRSMIRQLAITPDYAVNIGGGKGFTLSENLVEALVVDTGFGKQAKTIYILKPNKDNGYKPVDWDETPESDDYLKQKFALKYLSEGRMALWEYEDEEKVSLRLIDAESGKEMVKYKLGPAKDLKTSIKTMAQNSVLWRDGKHFTYLSSNSNAIIYNMETNEAETVFVNAEGNPVSGRAVSSSMLTDGSILTAILCDTEDSDYFNPDYELRYRIGDGETVVISAPADRYFCVKGDLFYKGIVKTGGSGLILANLSRDRERTDGIFVYDTKKGQSSVIDTEQTEPDAISIYMGDVKPRFLTITDDKVSYGSTMKIYDAASGKEINRIDLNEIRDEIVSVLFLNEDNDVAVWTKSKMISIYNVDTGKQVNEVVFNGLEVTSTGNIYLEKAEDRERERVFLYTYEGGNSGMTAMVLDTNTWEKKADLCGFTAFCPETNEIYKFKNTYMDFVDEKDEILKGKAYTLEDLIEKAQQMD